MSLLQRTNKFIGDIGSGNHNRNGFCIPERFLQVFHGAGLIALHFACAQIAHEPRRRRPDSPAAPERAGPESHRREEVATQKVTGEIEVNRYTYRRWCFHGSAGE